MLQKEVDISVKTDHLITSRDLNARVGNVPILGVIGSQGERTINENGNTLRTFVNFNKLKMTNSFFQKEGQQYTWSARGSKSIIDYIIVNEKLVTLVEYTHVYGGLDIYSDHYLVLSKIHLLERWKKATFKKDKNIGEVYKVHLLQEGSCRTLYQSRPSNYFTSSTSGDGADIDCVVYDTYRHRHRITDLGRGDNG